jgi:hypothetical protein
MAKLSPNHLLFSFVSVGAPPSLLAAFAAIKDLLELDSPDDNAVVEHVLINHLKFSAAQAKL